MSSQPQTPINNRHDDDEIDLFELFQTLWNSKLLIIACSILGLIIAGAYAFTAKEQWTSEAYIAPSKINANLEYLSQLQKFGLMSKYDSINYEEKPKNNFNDLEIANIFNDFIVTLESIDNRNQFISNYSDSNNTSVPNFAISGPDKKNDALYKISLSTTDAEISKKLLSEYIAWSEDVVRSEQMDRFNFDLQNLSLLTKQQIDDLEFSAKNNKQKHIYEIQKALQIAKAANIQEFSAAGTTTGEKLIINNTDGISSTDINGSPYLFLFGEKYLNAMLSIEQSEPVIYPAEYYELQRTADSLDSMDKNNLDIAIFSYQLSPTLPSGLSKPKRTLIMLIGIILGGMLGVFWALVRDALRKRKAAL